MKGKIKPSKKKKWTVDQLNKVIPSTIEKSMSRICKQLKVLFILKTTKRIASYRETNNAEECEKEVEHLKSLKAINHVTLASYFSHLFFPLEFPSTEGGYKDSDLNVVDRCRSNQKFQENLKELKEQILILQNERNELLAKEERIRKSQERKPKLSTSTHSLAVIFIHC
jgi:hypothetical protein